MNIPQENQKYMKARKRVKEIKDFYTHLIIFLTVLVIIILINVISYVTGRADSEQWNFWFLFPFGFWAFAVLMHGLRTFLFGRESSWEKRKIKEIMEEMDSSKPPSHN